MKQERKAQQISMHSTLWLQTIYYKVKLVTHMNMTKNEKKRCTYEMPQEMKLLSSV